MSTSTDWHYPLGLFDAFGVELEYMIVDSETLDVRPVADALFKAAAGADVSDVEPDGPDGEVSWSNELALHVVEFKTQRPAASLEGLDGHFQSHVVRANAMLEPMRCKLLPTGMHPWMNPDTETKLWPHENNTIYATYDRIFGCKGHGWGNLQSTHVNLPFANDDEFGRLYAAIRLVLPLIPALAASSPVADGRWSPVADYRLEVYRNNSKRVPMMAGHVIPEPTFSRASFDRDVLEALYKQLEPLDPEGILRHEFANARGGMARFDRGAVEIRLIDIQECPRADIAIVELVVATVRSLVEERWMSYKDQKNASTETLHAALLDTIKYAEKARIRDRALLGAFGMSQTMMWGTDLWSTIADLVLNDDHPTKKLVQRMICAGTLSSRISGRLRRFPTRIELHTVYSELAECLQQGELFDVP